MYILYYIIFALIWDTLVCFNSQFFCSSVKSHAFRVSFTHFQFAHASPLAKELSHAFHFFCLLYTILYGVNEKLFLVATLELKMHKSALAAEARKASAFSRSLDFRERDEKGRQRKGRNGRKGKGEKRERDKKRERKVDDLSLIHISEPTRPY